MSESRINNFEVKYESEDKSLVYEIHIQQGFPLKRNCYGKTWAKRTQAILYRNGFIVETGYVTKHHRDKDDLRYAVVNAVKPIIKKISKHVRVRLWQSLFKEIELCQEISN